MTVYDVAIVGSGFAGSILARVLRSQGLRVLLLERGRHPRFAIGESTTPLANFALERLARRYGLPDLHQLSTHGRWLEHLPRLRRGLKRGFTFYRHRRGEPFRNSADNDARLLVAASPDDHLADTHWLRQDVDHHLVRRAVGEGVEYLDRTEVVDVRVADGGVELEARNEGGRTVFRAGIVVDASGPRGVLSRALPIPPAPPSRVQSGLLFAHFQGLRAFDEIAREAGAVFDPGPYPDERAAVHHLLDQGWVYVLPFDHGVVSAGIVMRPGDERPVIAEMRSDLPAAWERILAGYPSLAAQFASARPIFPIRYVERLQYRLDRSAGKRWFVLPHAYAFYDPLFSTGIAWSLLAVERLAEILGNDPSGGDWRRYDRSLSREADQIERLIEAAYLTMTDFDLFVSVAFLYFATVSFEEVRQRLTSPVEGEPYAWRGFLGAGDADLEALFAETGERLRAGRRDGLRAWIERRIAPFNVAGLADPDRRNLYPVDLDVLVRRAHLLGLDRAAVQAALPRLRGDAGGEGFSSRRDGRG
ncbi:MAG: FAD-dependent oxidoreductase [Thermoanaerobaculia bacterium]